MCCAARMATSSAPYHLVRIQLSAVACASATAPGQVKVLPSRGAEYLGARYFAYFSLVLYHILLRHLSMSRHAVKLLGKHTCRPHKMLFSLG